MKKHIAITATLILLATVSIPTAQAQEDCRPIYGGGITKEQSCDKKVKAEVTVTKKPNPTPKVTKYPTSSSPGTTKGGLPVTTPKPVTKTPSTGPEMLGLIALVPAAAAGIYLRRKA